MLSGVLSLIVLSVVQLVLVVHVRNILVDSASEGATYAALADRTAADGAARTETLIRRSVSERYAQDVSAEEITVDGVRMVRVTVVAPTPVVGLFSAGSTMTLRGHGVRDE